MIKLITLYIMVICSAAADQTSRINLGVYYESVCPYSRAFITTQLAPTYAKLKSLISLDLVPYGNANYSFINQTSEFDYFDVNYTCQHGDSECFGNFIQSCAIAANGSEASLALVNCMFESDDWNVTEISGPQCAKSLNLDWNYLKQCATGPQGRGIELLMAQKTDRLNPVHKFVPWIVANDVHNTDIQTRAEYRLFTFICDTYNGPNKPKDCSDI